MDALRVGRATQEIARRRRRHRRLVGILAILLFVAAGLVVVPDTSSRRSQWPAHVASAAPALALASRESRADAAQAAQVADAKRLAALGRPLYCGGRQRQMVALTFDDGPGGYTRLAVKQLRSYNLTATFFLVGKEIRARPHLLGLEKPFAAFGDHTMTHPFLPALPPAEIDRQMAGAQTLIEHTTGEPVVLFRPPYEGHTAAVDKEARALGMVEVLWNVDSQDSLGANYTGIERNVIAGLKPGSIILMHENHGQTIRALPKIFRALKRDHLQAATVPELIAEDPPSRAQLRAGIAGCPLSNRSRGNGS